MTDRAAAPDEASYQSVCTFGPFRLDAARFELKRANHRVRLSAGLLKLLMLFTSRPGELITRKEIAACLWSDSRYVDVESGINTAVNRLRVALGDEAAKPAYIDTVVGVGYRFVAEVKRTADARPAASPAKEVQLNTPESPIERPSLLSTGNDAPPLRLEAQPHTPAEDPSPLPSERERQVPARHGAVPAESAHTRHWAKAPVLGLALTALVAALALSLYLVRFKAKPGNALGLALDDVRQVTFSNSDVPIQYQSLSHDGSMVAFSDGSGVSVRSLDRGIDRKLLTPDNVSIRRISWGSGDSAILLSARSAGTGHVQLWLCPLKTAPPQLLVEDGADAAASPSTPRIAFTRNNDSELWTVNQDGTGLMLLHKEATPARLLTPVWNADGTLIACEIGTAPLNAPNGVEERRYKWQLAFVSSTTGKIVSAQKDVHAGSVSLTANGFLFFTVVPSPEEDNAAGLFMVPVDGKTGRFLSRPQAVSWPFGTEPSIISASENGKKLSMLLNRQSTQVHTARVDQQTYQLTEERSLDHSAPDNFPHSWTPSGDAVLFESDDQDKYAIYKERPDGSPAMVLARSVGGAVLPFVTPDGQWVLFDNLYRFHPNAIYRVPLEGGEIEELPTHGQTGDFQCSLSSKGRCVLRKIEDRRITFYALDPLGGEGALLGAIDWVENAFADWSLSPDGTTVAMPSHDSPAGIRLVRLGGEPQSHTIALPGVGRVVQAIWTPDARGFYLETQDSTGYTLSHVTLAGAVTQLRKSPAPTWGVPSRDGSHVAFGVLEKNTNVWVATSNQGNQ